MNSAGVPQAAPAPHLAPGRMGVRLAVLSTAIGLAAVNTGNNLLYVMLSLILGLAVVSSVAARRALHTLRVDARFPREVVCGEPFCFTVETAGRFPWLPQTWIDVRVDGLGGDPVTVTVPISADRGSGRRTARLVLPRRGVHTRLGLSAATSYPLDLHVNRARIAWRGELVVLPRFDRIPSLARLVGAAGRRPGDASPTRAPGTGAELRQIRTYTWNDDARRMHWRATARAGRPMVRELEQERERALDLALDTEAADPEAFEAVVSRAAALLDAARREGVPVRLFAPGADAGGLSGHAASRFLAAVAAVPRGETAGWLEAHAPEGALVLSCDPARATPMAGA